MGIRNREGALYIATGVDNTGLYAGRREAMGVIKAIASQITSFDVFSGIGISAATAFASAAKSAYNFEKEFHKNMLEVATISTQVSGSMADFMNRVLSITQQIPVTAPEAAKALYQIVSAGHDGAAGMQILEVAAKSAVGGLTDTATAADAITTILNAYKLSADQAANISDQLFTTVRLGKTDFGQLGQSIAQVAPIAASYGVEIDQVLAAVASLTKQGTPTAQAMTQIRAAIIGTSKVLGDGAFEGRTFQEALAEVAARANGSESKLRELVPEIEAVNGVLGMTGQNAKAAASDLGELQKSAGSTEAAFRKMQEDVDNQMKLLSNNIHAALRPMGEAILKEVSDVAKAVNEAFANGDAKAAMKSLGDLIVIVTGAFIGYKGALLASAAAQNLHTKAILLSRLASIQHITTTHLLTNAIKVQTAALLKNVAALATNPYVLAAAAIAALGYGIYSYATQATAAEKAQQNLNARWEEQKKLTEDIKVKTEELLSTVQDETKANLERNKALKILQEMYPKIFAQYDLETLKLSDILQYKKQIAEQDAQRNYQSDKSYFVSLAARRDKLNEEISYRSENYGNGQHKYGEFFSKTTSELKKEREMVTNEVDILYASLKEKSEMIWETSPREVKIVSLEQNIASLKKEKEKLEKLLSPGKDYVSAENTAYNPLGGVASPQDIARLNVVNDLLQSQSTQLAQLNQQAEGQHTKEETVLQRRLTLTKELAAAEAKLKKLRSSDSTATDGEIAEAEKERDEIKKKLQALTGLSDKEGDKRKQAQQELSRSILESELKLQADRIAIMKDGKDKRVLLADQEYKETLSVIEKARAEYQKKVKEAGGSEDPAVMATFSSRESAAKNKRDTDVASINKEYFDDYAKRTKALTDVFLSEEKKRVSAVRERYDEERMWAQEQLTTGGMSEEQYQSYVINIDKAEAEESLRSLLDKYKDYARQKEELERQYTDEIATLTQKRTDANKAEVDAAITEARKRHKEEAAGLDFEAFKKSIDFSEVFGNLNRLSDQALTELIQKMKEFRSEAATNLKTDELKEYMDALEKLRDESFDRKNGWAEAFGLIPDVIKERTKLEEEYAAAEELALKAAEKKKAAEEELQDSTSAFNSLIKKLTGAQDDLTDANEEYVVSLIKRKGLEQGLSEEEIEANIQTYKESAASVQQLAQGVADAGEESNKASSLFAKAGEALQSFKNNAGNTVAIVDAIIKGVHQGIQAMSQISDSFLGMYEALGKDTSIDTTIGKFGEFMNLLSEFDNYAYSAWENLKSGNIAGAVADTISSITSVIKNIAAWGDKKKERKIERLQEQVEELDKSYEKLSDSIEKAYSVDASALIDQQNEMLEKQKVLIQQQIAEEEKKKNTDNDRIKEWNEQIENIDKTLADNKEKAKDAIFGEDLKSAIDNFANAYAEAWTAGEDRAKSMKDVARNMIKQTVIELIKSSAGLGETVKKIREMILGFLSDGVVDEWEQRELDSYIESETARLDAKYGWADKYMKGDKEIDLGISGDSLADTIVEGLRAGKAGIKDFSGSFEEMMKTAVLNSLKTKYLEGPLKEFQKKFAALSESGGQLTEAEIEELRAMYAQIIDGAKVQFDSLKEISGLDFLDGSENTLKGAFAKASQESIDLLAGQTGAQRVAVESIREQLRFIFELQREGWADVKAIRELTVKIDRNSEQVARNTRLIHDMVDRISESAQKTAESTQKAAECLDGTISVKVKM